MDTPCHSLPVLGDPPLIGANGQYVIVIDENGDYRRLARRDNAIAGQWGDDFFLADGSDNAPITLDQLIIDLQTETLEGLVSRRSSGRIAVLKNNTATEMIPVLVNGALTLENKADSAIPSVGTGFVIRQPLESESEFAGDHGMWWIASDGTVTKIEPGSVNGQILKWMDGAPVFASSGGMSFSGTKGVSGIDDVVASRQSGDNTRVDIEVGEIVVSDGVDEVVATSVSVTIDINSGVALLGADAALVSDNWYYLYIITDDAGTTVSAVASNDPSGPDLSDPAFSTLPYTRWGLASICFWTGSQIIGFQQRGRRFATERQIISSEAANGITTSWSALTVAKQVNNDRNIVEAVPPIAKTFSGIVGGSGSSDVGNVTLSVAVASRIDGIGEQYIGSKRDTVDIPGDGFKKDLGSFHDLVCIDPTNGDTMLFWRGSATNSYRKVAINGYTI